MTDMTDMIDIFVYEHVRTPRGQGRPEDALHAITPIQVAAQVLQALRERSSLDPRQLEDVGLGAVMAVGEQGAVIARHRLV